MEALAHPTRLAILSELLKGVKCVGTIQDLLGTPQANVSQHLAVLRRQGLVSCHKDGKLRCYYLTKPDMVRDLFAFFGTRYRAVKLTRSEVLRQRSRNRKAGKAKT